MQAHILTFGWPESRLKTYQDVSLLNSKKSFYISAQCDFSAVMLKVLFPEAAIPAFHFGMFVCDRHSETNTYCKMKIQSPFTRPPHVVLVFFSSKPVCIFFFFFHETGKFILNLLKPFFSFI